MKSLGLGHSRSCAASSNDILPSVLIEQAAPFLIELFRTASAIEKATYNT